MTTPTIETDLGTILNQINQNLVEFRKETNQRFEQVNQRFDNLNKDITEIKIEQARLEERMTAVEGEIKELKSEIKDFRTSQIQQIWALIGILGMVGLGAVVRFVITAIPSGKP
jgi:septation ring formation regulator EzrA